MAMRGARKSRPHCSPISIARFVTRRSRVLGHASEAEISHCSILVRARRIANAAAQWATKEPGQDSFGFVVTSTKSSAWKSKGPRASGPGGSMSPLATPNSAFINVDDRDVLDVPQVAQLLGVGRNTIYALVARNAIPHRRLGKAIRFSRAAVMSWLASWSSRDAEERH